MRTMDAVRAIGAAAVMSVVATAWCEPAKEVNVRDGVGRFIAKASAGQKVTVAYLGGSITAMNGWRNLTTEWLSTNFPSATVREVAASIGGTGSDLGVFRVGRDALVHRPDLLFVEFATNDHGQRDENVIRSMEGIVRQTWRANPETDIVFVYTITHAMTNDYVNGSLTRTAAAMERLADHYGIPSVCFGTRVAERLRAGALAIDPGARALLPAGTPVFAPDGVHPSPEGHALYLASIQAAFAQFAAKPTPRRATLPPPLDPENLENAKMVEIEPSMLTGKWKRLDDGNDKYRSFSNRAGTMWETEEPGAKLHFRFRGTTCRIYDLLGPDGGQVRVRVDGRETGRPVPRFDSYCTYWRLATLWVYEGQAGEHEVEIVVDAEQPDRHSVAFRLKDPEKELKSPKYNGTRFWPAKIMLVGDLVP